MNNSNDTISGGVRVSEMDPITDLSQEILEHILIPTVDINGNNKIPKSISMKVLRDGFKEDFAGYHAITCAAFINLMNNAGLDPNIKYVLSDFKSYMWVPGMLRSSNDVFNTMNNVDVLADEYIDIHPVLTASTPSTLNERGFLMEYPHIQIVWKYIKTTDPYYGNGRFPNQAYSLGIIDRMIDTVRNIDCGFDYINAVVRIPGMGGCYIPPAVRTRAAIINPTEYFEVARFFGNQYRNGSFYAPNNGAADWSPIADNKVNFLEEFYDLFLRGRADETEVSEIPKLELQYYDRGITSTKANSDDYINNSRSFDNLAFWGADNIEQGRIATFFCYRDFFFKPGNDKANKVKNIFIDRSPIITDTTHNYYRKSNVPIVILAGGRYFFDGANVQKYGYYQGSYEFSDIHIYKSDFIYIGRHDQLHHNIASIDIQYSFGINLSKVHGNCKIVESNFLKIYELSNTSFFRVHYSAGWKIINSNLDRCCNIRVSQIINSKLFRCTDIATLYRGSYISNSELSNVSINNLEHRVTELSNLGVHKYGYIGNIFDIVSNCKFDFLNGFNNNKSFMTVEGVVGLINCEFSHLGKLLIALGTNVALDFNPSNTAYRADVTFPSNPTNNFSMIDYPWLVDSLKVRGDGENWDLALCWKINSEGSPLSVSYPYPFCPIKHLNILYNMQNKIIMRTFMDPELEDSNLSIKTY